MFIIFTLKQFFNIIFLPFLHMYVSDIMRILYYKSNACLLFQKLKQNRSIKVKNKACHDPILLLRENWQ